MLNGKRIVVVLPAYNAERTLEATVRDLPEVVDETILVDDCSIDSTVELARKLNLTVYLHERNRGYGANQKTCYTQALARGADVIVMTHPDYQYSPLLVTALASMIAYGVYDIALGSRMLGGALKGGMPVYKYMANRALTAFQNLLTGGTLSEYHTGYRAYSRELWLWIGAAAGVVGGADRQVDWIAPIVLIPWLAWLRRTDRHFVMSAAACYAACGIVIAVLIHFFSQPYAPLELSKPQLFAIVKENSLFGAGMLVCFLLACIMVSLPAFVCFFAGWRKAGLRTLGALLLASAAFALLLHRIGDLGIVPYSGNVVSRVGIIEADLVGRRPLLMSHGFRAFMTGAIDFVMVASVWFVARRWRLRRDFLENPAYAAFALFTLGYLALLIPGALTGLIFDRYALPIAPLLAIMVLYEFQRSGKAIPKAAWACLALFGAYGIATTHDYGAILRARAAAADAMAARGVARDHLAAGFEFDGWTHLQKAHYIRGARYEDRIFFPYHADCWHGFWDHVTAVQPDYVEMHALASQSGGPGLPRVNFQAWIPPFQRSIVVWKRSDLNWDACKVRD